MTSAYFMIYIRNFKAKIKYYLIYDAYFTIYNSNDKKNELFGKNLTYWVGVWYNGIK